ncbi:MAG: EAL domain-containing protein [Marivibrio sp.]|uniref:putative bifunctional diguanylate cyclase/phosphodiesterase n=1 Tax=Marivibrio sp. TaxID=2039719 RepID=UPI0032EC881D
MPIHDSSAGSAIAAALSALIGGLTGFRKGRRDGARGAASQTALQNALDYMADGIVVTDEALTLVAWNRRYREIFSIAEGGIVEGDPIAKAIRSAFEAGVLVRPDARAIDAHVEARLADIRDGRGAVQLERLADGRWIEIVRNALPQGGFVSTFTDVTERKRAEDALRVSEERYALAAQGSSEGIWDWDLAAERVYYSPRWRAMLGLSPDMISGRPDDWFNRVHPRDVDALRAAIDSYLDGASEQFAAEFRMLHTDDDYLWVAASGLAVRSPHDGRPQRLVGSMTDISERKRAEEQLIHDALYDSVTGLPNRALFLDRIDQTLQRRRLQGADDAGEGFAVLFLDLDRFKVINDSLGHDVGDELLIDVARRLESAIKPGDSLARLASDEFGVLLGEVRRAEDALETAHWLQSDLAAAFYLRGQEVFTSVCIGVALPSAGFRKAEDMLRAADIAMYRAKDGGQSSTAVFDPSMQSRAISQLQLESDLRRAVDRDEIEVYYQPIVRFDTGRIAGFEVLARWRHTERGLVAPADFIPPAEDVGLIAAIGAQALRKSARAMREWMRRYGGEAPEAISVNLSGRQLQDPDLVRDIELLLAQTGLPGSRLKLEVTESMIMHNPESTARTLMELKDLGVTLSIDDFGTGYSSLSYLHRFPFDTLKIDRSFVAAMEEKRENLEIIRTIALLAHTLGMDVIAEGVESPGQLKRLRELGCESGQGFLFSHPTDADGAEAYLKAARRWDVDALIAGGDRAAE